MYLVTHHVRDGGAVRRTQVSQNLYYPAVESRGFYSKATLQVGIRGEALSVELVVLAAVELSIDEPMACLPNTFHLLHNDNTSLDHPCRVLETGWTEDTAATLRQFWYRYDSKQLRRYPSTLFTCCTSSAATATAPSTTGAFRKLDHFSVKNVR